MWQEAANFREVIVKDPIRVTNPEVRKFKATLQLWLCKGIVVEVIEHFKNVADALGVCCGV